MSNVAIPDLTNITATPKTDWQGVIRDFIETVPYSDRWEASTYDIALDRLMNGDVKRTQYGIRVAIRPDLGDDRANAAAYWPGKRKCLCYSKKSRGYCSHELAAALLSFKGGK